MAQPLARCPRPNPIQRVVSWARTTKTMDDRLDWGDKLMETRAAWRRDLYGAGVRVAVIDTGVYGHPDLAGAVAMQTNLTDDGLDNPAPHGTGVAGVIGARLNDKGVVGVAPRCDLISAKVLGNDGSGTLNQVAGGVEWAIDQGADVINLSLGGTQGASYLRDAVDEAERENVVVVAASGNNGNEDPAETSYPAAYPSVLSVGALEKGKRRADYSNAGVDLMAPGSKRATLKPPEAYWTPSGTSFASPSIAGVVALYLAHERANGRNPKPKDVRQALHEGANDLAAPGQDPLTGFGWVSVRKLIN